MLAGNDAFFPEFESDDFLEEVVLTTSASSVTFSGLGTYATAGYKHLQIRMVARADGSSTQDSMTLTFNGVGGTSYAAHYLEGSGTNVTSGAFTARQNMILPTASSGSSPANSFAAIVTDILDPFATTKYTTTKSLAGMTARNYATLWSGLFMDTSAISSMTIAPFSSSNFVDGSRFSLYGSKG